MMNLFAEDRKETIELRKNMAERFAKGEKENAEFRKNSAYVSVMDCNGDEDTLFSVRCVQN
jgi:hypothetical protein